MSDFKVRVYDYIAHNSRTCPFCGSGTVVYDQGDFGGEVTQEGCCGTCGSVWTDNYRLESIEVVRVGEKALDSSITPELIPFVQRWLMIVDGDNPPLLDGPYESEETRMDAARSHRAETGDGDRLYKLDVGLDVGAETADFTSEEMGDQQAI